jgi:hypothetical protein
MTKDERRAAMPWTTEIVDDMRKHFGELNSIIAKENGHRVEWRKASGKILSRSSIGKLQKLSS